MASFVLNPFLRFASSVLAGILAPMAVLTLIGLGAGSLPPLHLLLATIPLSAFLALLAAAPWPALSNESIATRWFVSLIIPVGALFDVSAFLALFSSDSRYDAAFVVFTVIWALLAAGATAWTAHWLKLKADHAAKALIESNHTEKTDDNSDARYFRNKDKR